MNAIEIRDLSKSYKDFNLEAYESDIARRLHYGLSW